MNIRQEISSAVEAYRDSLLSIDQFEDRFRNIAQGLFAYPDDARALLLLIENLLAELRAGYIGQPELRQELTIAIRPFEQYSVALNLRHTNLVSNSNDSALYFPVASANNNLGVNEAFAA